jgi:methyl-accepting chemotaxis protein
MSAQKKGRGRGAPGRTAASRQAILLEAIQEQNRATIEAVFASKQELQRNMDETRRELTLRLGAVEAIVKKNSEDIRQNSEDIRQNSEDIRQNSEDIRKNSEQIRLNTEELGRHSEELRRIAAMLERKSDQASLIALEKRVTALEKRVGL